jgi:hypothetical protein
MYHSYLPQGASIWHHVSARLGIRCTVQHVLGAGGFPRPIYMQSATVLVGVAHNLHSCTFDVSACPPPPNYTCRTPAGGYHSRAQHIRLPAQHFTAAPCRQRSSSAGLQQRQQQQHGRQQLRVVCQAATDLAKFANQAYLDKAAQRFRLGRGGAVVTL